MAWPNSNDYCEVIQVPQLCFSDPELKAGEVICGTLGTPQAFAGNFADVYQVRSANGSKSWAVKCFTRRVTGLRERYREISAHLEKSKLKVMVDFKYLEEGIRIRGEWFPILKMQWVSGFTLRQFVEERLNDPELIERVYEVWLNIEPMLRDAKLAHGDLQHGNVMLIPGPTRDSLALRLIDYDGMWVPKLANQPPDEVGHPSYQHPRRAAERKYTSEIDRFPHLAIALALHSLTLPEGPELWKEFDNGDNLLFTKRDFQQPSESDLLKKLWNLEDEQIQNWVGHLVLAAHGKLEETTPLEDLMTEGEVAALSTRSQNTVQKLLGLKDGTTISLSPDGKKRKKKPVRGGVAAPAPSEGEIVVRVPLASMLLIGGFAAVCVLGLAVFLAVWLGRGREPVAVAANQARANTPPATTAAAAPATSLGKPSSPSVAPPENPVSEDPPPSESALKMLEPGESPPGALAPSGDEEAPLQRPSGRGMTESRPESSTPSQDSPPADPAPLPEPVVLKPDKPFDVGEVLEERTDNLAGITFCWCPPGEQTILAGTAQKYTEKFDHGFWMGKHEVTQAQWAKIMRTYPWRSGRESDGQSHCQDDENYPAVYVGQEDAVEFCLALSQRERLLGRLPLDWIYVLPTETRWEYACRAGTKGRFFFGSDETRIGRFAQYRTNTLQAGRPYAQEVGQLLPNDWGLHDTHGNVWEWCGTEVPGQIASKLNVFCRGGSWNDPAPTCASSFRPLESNRYSRQSSTIGFRVALVYRKGSVLPALKKDELDEDFFGRSFPGGPSRKAD